MIEKQKLAQTYCRVKQTCNGFYDKTLFHHEERDAHGLMAGQTLNQRFPDHDSSMIQKVHFTKKC
jgi:hypothetical protein